MSSGVLQTIQQSNSAKRVSSHTCPNLALSPMHQTFRRFSSGVGYALVQETVSGFLPGPVLVRVWFSSGKSHSFWKRIKYALIASTSWGAGISLREGGRHE